MNRQHSMIYPGYFFGRVLKLLTVQFRPGAELIPIHKEPNHGVMQEDGL
jgi:hypothetical protein